MGEVTERRNLGERAEIVRGVVNAVVQNPSVTLTAETLEVWLNVPADAAQRILGRLASSGLVREIKKGVFVRASGTRRQVRYSGTSPVRRSKTNPGPAIPGTAAPSPRPISWMRFCAS